jgi:ABC-type lipoprotein release transport system permease subunit
MKTLGFVRHQVSAAVSWQATTVVILASLAGIPIGVLLARWGWARFAENIGVPSVPQTPVLALVLFVPVAVVLANMIAALPARAAARTQPAVVLRAE